MQWVQEGDRWRWQDIPGVDAWFTTRHGGIGAPPYDSLNLSFSVGDDPDTVKENRRLAVPQGLSRLVMAQQIHQDGVAWVDSSESGRGALDPTTSLQGLDGLLTRDVHLTLGMGFADCVPIFLADVFGRWVGILHAGWRGTVLGVQRRAVMEIVAAGYDLGDIRVGIGPSIGPCCYEVDRAVEEPVRKVLTTASTLGPGRDEAHWMLDLWSTNRLILESLGISREHIAVLGLCTSCHHEFFSYRRDQTPTGRMGGFICRT